MMFANFNKQGRDYIGCIRMPGLVLSDVKFVPSIDGDEGKPDYAIVHDASFLRIGAAWAKTSRTGKPYLSVIIDWPSLPAPINCALIDLEGGKHVLVWSRNKPKAAYEDVLAD